MSKSTYRTYLEKLGNTDAESFIGMKGDLFFDPEVRELKVSDGVTAGGNAVSGGGGGGGSGSSSLESRATASATTSSIANDVADDISVTGYNSYALLKVETDRAAWVTIYTSSSARSSDSSRDINTDPEPGSGVISEVITTGASTQILSPAVIGFNESTSDNGTIYMKVVNKSGSTSTVQVTLTLVKIEA